jgi:hypothetical protein
MDSKMSGAAAKPKPQKRVYEIFKGKSSIPNAIIHKWNQISIRFYVWLIQANDLLLCGL